MTRTMLFQRLIVLSVLAATATGIAGCSGGGGVSAATTTASTPSTTADANPLAAVNPCNLLTSTQVNQLGLVAKGPSNTTQSRGCTWQKSGNYTVGIDVRENQGIGATGADGITKVTLQSHDALQDTSSGFGCDIAIATSKSSSADVVVSGVEGMQQQCQIAMNYATLIEPQLPAQQK